MLDRECSVEEVFARIQLEPQLTILFIDQTQFCRDYAGLPWIRRNQIDVVEIDPEILDAFQIGKVPQFRFFLNGNETGCLVGTADFEAFERSRTDSFGNIKSIKKV